MTKSRPSYRRGILWGIGAAVLAVAACSDDDCDSNNPGVTPEPRHPQVVLRDVHGAPLPVDSTEPYSPRQTCGRCHDVDTIAGAYHFQQGRVDATGRIEERLTKPWEAQVAVLSPGMFGKW